MTAAIDSCGLRGEDRLAFIAAGDGDGVVSVAAVARWCGCNEGEAAQIINGMVERGIFMRVGHEVVAPSLWSLARGIEEEVRSRVAKEPKRKPISKKLRQMVYQRDGWQCAYCGSDEQLTLDHITPLSAGGEDTEENLATCCLPCNLSKGTKPLEEWTGRQ